MDLTTKYWMAGVVGMMVAFGLVAFIGYMRQSKNDSSDD